MNVLGRSLLGLAVASLALAAVACGGDDDDDDDGNGDGATATADGSGDGGGGNEVDVVLEGFAFAPTQFTVPAGEDVVINLENRDSAPHTFTVYLDNAFSEMQGTTLPLDAGASDEVRGTFDAGTYFFRCEVHPATMTGQFSAE
jgi:plastocyanin